MTTQERADAADLAANKASQRALTIGLCAIVVAIAFETIAVATAMPVAARDLDGLKYYAWAFSAFLIGMLFATVLTGRLSDRTGPAKPLLVGLVTNYVGFLAPKFTMFSSIGLMVAVLVWRPQGLYPVVNR